MLVAHELEKEFKDLGRFEKNNMRVHEKTIATRIDRKGTIRVVNGIPALKPMDDANQNRRKAFGNSSLSPEDNKAHQAGRSNKLNIFSSDENRVAQTEEALA